LVTVNGEAFIGLHGGATGTLSADASTVNLNNWVNVGREGGNGTLTLTNASTLAVGGDLRAGMFGSGSVGLIQVLSGSTATVNYSLIVGSNGANTGTVVVDGGSTLNILDQVNMAQKGYDSDAPGATSATLNIGPGSIMNVGGHFYAGNVQDDGNASNYSSQAATVNLTMTGGTLAIGTDPTRREWAQLGYGNSTVNIALSGAALYRDYGNTGICYGNSNGTITIGDTARMIVDGTLRLGNSGNCTTTLSGSSQVSAETQLAIGDYHSNTSVSMLGNASLTSGTGSLNVGQYGSTNATLTLAGTSHVTVNGMAALGWNWGNDINDIGANNTVTINSPGAVVAIHGGVGTYGQVDDATAGGNDNTPGDHTYSFLNGLVVGGCGGAGTYTQNAGLTTNDNPVALGQFDFYYWDIERPNTNGGDYSQGASAGSGILNLNGGTFSAPGIVVDGNTAVIAGTTGTINFNGGTLKASASNPDFIAPAATGGTVVLNVLKNSDTGLGAVIDTNGNDVGINQTLVSGTAVGTKDGGVTKLGAGTLYLNPTTPNSYTGLTTVKAGTVRLGANAQAAVIGAGGAGGAGNADIQASAAGGVLASGKLVFNDGAPGLADQIKNLLTASYNGGVNAWTAGTFQSSTAAATGTTLGWVDDGTTTTVAATIPGDFNLVGLWGSNP
jgi:autotransporter-associated beta strand protein